MKILKKLLLVLPWIINLCSCINQKQSIVLDKKIEILNNLTIPNLEFEQEYISEEINLKYENVLKTNINLKIINAQNSNEQVPNWIYINKENKLVIEKYNKPGNYFFAIYAYSDVDHIKSNDIQFSFIITKKTEFPNDIKVNLSRIYFFIDEKISFKIPITYTIKNSDDITYDFNTLIRLTEHVKPVDLMGKDLFHVNKKNNDWFIECSNKIDETYLGNYVIDVFFVSKDYLNTIKNKYPIKVSIVRMIEYLDPETKYIYQKFSRNGTWTLFKLKNNTSFIEDIPKMIQGSWVAKIGDNLCKNSNVTKLTTVFLPESIIDIGDYAFYDQQYLGYISMPKVEKIGNYAFYNCIMLMFANDTTQICLKSIGEYAFYKTKNVVLKNPQDLTYISDYSFAYSGINDLIIGDNCNFIGKSVFSMCQQLVNLQFNSSTPPILLDNPFFGCDKLETISVPKHGLNLYLQNDQWGNIKQKLIGI